MPHRRSTYFRHLLFFVLIGSSLQEILPRPVHPAIEATALRLLKTDPQDMRFCHYDRDCANPNTPICDRMMQLCRSTQEAAMDSIHGKCTTSLDCRPMYHCSSGQCHFSGPKACDSPSDCLHGAPRLHYDCLDLPKSAPGKRCWLKCGADKDCHECDAGSVCRLPDELRAKLSCCNGHCQRRTVCEPVSTEESTTMHSGAGRRGPVHI
ncbi:hypothetical protein RvY_01223 [Ramazzottius varieornatus]|uniref:Dickkopf N-terminal cysteine-rich domain-containing protein n=1 Tax=Ramazzottius varieornatus TaxID=947166 RepID=A0A1D1UJ39_RAMVA|nr:hypothetical protein RvY_01223 [Ramazzottius varieornatus]